MGTIEAYGATRMQTLLDASQHTLAVTGTKPNLSIVATRHGGGTATWPITTPQGDQGPIGNGVAGVEPSFASVTPGDWTDMPLASDWGPHGGSNYDTLRYRMIGTTRVELDGWARYNGTSTTLTSALIAQYDLVPDAIIPSFYRHLRAYRNGRYAAYVVMGGGPGLGILQYTGIEAPPLLAGEWISFCGITYDL